jgi:hypothetical protein
MEPRKDIIAQQVEENKTLEEDLSNLTKKVRFTNLNYGEIYSDFAFFCRPSFCRNRSMTLKDN